MDLWRIYGKHAWRRSASFDAATEDKAGIFDENRQLYAELTGEN